MSEEQPTILEKCIKIFKHKNDNVRETIEDLIEEAQCNGEDEFSEHEQLLLNNILDIKDKKGYNAMVPRAEIISFPKSGTVRELTELMIKAGHSRIPIHGESMDDMVGIVHMLDLAKYLLKGDMDTKVSDIIEREIKFVSPNAGVLELLKDMQMSKNHMALVIDEYGGVNGLVTIEDLLEEIVGDIVDEYDFEEDPLIEIKGKNKIIVDAGAELDEIQEASGLDLSKDVEKEDLEIDTIGGYVFHLAGRVPSRGEVFEGPDNIKFRIIDADPIHIKKIMIILPKEDICPNNN
ncbi:MAG: hemolysin family protein [Lactobacillus sp.]|nr:hemolysin family protein [Lactobacillus sp.]